MKNIAVVASLFLLLTAQTQAQTKQKIQSKKTEEIIQISPNANAVHVDLYDRTDVIPFDKLTTFFTQILK
ncbi:hypothetical protein FC093_22210 [Ilyomonas limi]|uniref:Uncharacterized protein n=1 Tax=Ilyomonas limi TaxID=2575867 RepID=A0A4U3KUH5_9BACT|nr:hypothetical protein [Ilyomonas limi]TKK64586.1 hypothetical protein FC093_22210 [Ilyomonas limi]